MSALLNQNDSERAKSKAQMVSKGLHQSMPKLSAPASDPIWDPPSRHHEPENTSRILIRFSEDKDPGDHSDRKDQTPDSDPKDLERLAEAKGRKEEATSDSEPAQVSQQHSPGPPAPSTSGTPAAAAG